MAKKTDAQKQQAAEDRATLFGNDPKALREKLTGKDRIVTVGGGITGSGDRNERSKTRRVTQKGKFDQDAYKQAKADFNARGNNNKAVDAQNKGAGGGSGVSLADFSGSGIAVGGIDSVTPVNSKVRGR